MQVFVGAAQVFVRKTLSRNNWVKIELNPRFSNAVDPSAEYREVNYLLKLRQTMDNVPEETSSILLGCNNETHTHTV